MVRPFGGVFRRELLEARPSGRLTIEDRVEIYTGLQTGSSFATIAAQLGKSVSTISREVGGRHGAGRPTHQELCDDPLNTPGRAG